MRRSRALIGPTSVDTILATQVRTQHSTIFPDVYDRLSLLGADVLVTHEASSCHKYGFEAIDDLARALGVMARAVVAGQSVRAIAANLTRAPLTVSREIKRNGGRASYRATYADHAASKRAHRPKVCKLVENRALAEVVSAKL